jgi:3-hydroxyisobutyrate dehydrogenase
MKVGFIGLGSLGAPIARKIARSGFPLVVYDISPAAMQAFDEPGAESAGDPIETARRSEALCVCVRMDDELTALAGDGALFTALGESGIFIVHSTVAPELCQHLAVLAKRYGVALIDAGVSGGAPAALKGELSIYVGGEDEAIERARPLLESYGRIAQLGPVGRGMQGKLLNNLVSIANYGMSAAILDLGETLGFDRAQLRDALLAGSAESFALRAVPGLLRPETAAALRQLLGKDLDHARKLAPESDAGMAALVPAAESMLARLERAAAETG